QRSRGLRAGSGRGGRHRRGVPLRRFRRARTRHGGPVRARSRSSLRRCGASAGAWFLHRAAQRGRHARRGGRGRSLTVRLLHVIPSYLPATRYGGPVFATHALCAALVRQGFEVDVFTTTIDGPRDVEAVPGEIVSMDGVRVRYFASPFLRRLYYAPALERAMREGPDYDLVHLHSVFLWPTWAAARAARERRIPYVLSPRGMLVEDLVRRRSTWAKRAWIALVERANIERAAAIHVTSDVESAELARFGFRLPAVHCVPNGVDAST